MNENKCYNKLDIKIFDFILKHDFNIDIISNKRQLLSLISLANTITIEKTGILSNKNKLLNEINFTQYGIKNRTDANIDIKTDIIENTTNIIVTPNCNYTLQDSVDLPDPIDNNCKFAFMFFEDCFERLKIKAENVLEDTDDDKNIELYSKKNIQKARRIFYDARLMLEKVQEKNDKSKICIAYCINCYLINTIMYYQKMFSSFYNSDKVTKQELKIELYNSFTFKNMFKVINNECSIVNNINEKYDPSCIKLKWNGQINSLIALFYDLNKKDTFDNKKLLEADINELKIFISNYFTDKNGKYLNENTINTCFKNYRDDKRPLGEKRIEIEKYH